MIRRYGDTLTASVNSKGVLDVDTVKGCTVGMRVHPDQGCYGCCYAAKIARFRGMDFRHSVLRRTKGGGHASRIENAVSAAPYGFFRIGTMGDPCHAWEHTVRTVEWLAPRAVPVIVTKHWLVASTGQLERLVKCGAVMNTSVSALDSEAELTHRKKQLNRYKALGGVSVARVVSCAFNTNHPDGARMAAVQSELFNMNPMIDNPLRLPKTHQLVEGGVVVVSAVVDLNTEQTMSVARGNVYVGHCGPCPDKCGVAFCGEGHPRPMPEQLTLFMEAA